MSLSKRFTIRETACDSLIELLSRTSLGTNGARYRHLDTKNRILEADNPLFLSLEKDGKVQGNVTFCKRGPRWYVRYFAFSGQKQAAKSGNQGPKTSSNSRLKQEVADFYDEVFDGKYGDAPDAFYAFIDPNNERSKWMAEHFGFRIEAQLITQTFSRTKPKAHSNVRIITDEEQINQCLSEIQKTHAYFVADHSNAPLFYGLFDEQNELIGFTKITKANWVIERLPGTLGGFFTKLIRFTPGIRRIIKPDNHQFIVPEAVWIKQHSPQALTQLFEGILEKENRNMMLWWIDRRETLWRDTRSRVHWGLVHRMTSQPQIDVVVLRKNPLKLDELRSKPIFVSGWDMV